MMRVILDEDHASFRQAIAFILDREAGIEVVAQAGTLEEARRLLTEQDVDVAVVDFNLPDGSGPKFVEHLRHLNPRGVALILTASIDPETHVLALKAGATEVLHKSEAVTGIVEALGRLTFPARQVKRPMVSEGRHG